MQPQTVTEGLEASPMASVYLIRSLKAEVRGLGWWSIGKIASPAAEQSSSEQRVQTFGFCLICVPTLGDSDT